VLRCCGTVTEVGGVELWDYRNVFVCKVLCNINLVTENFKGHRTLPQVLLSL